MTIKFDKYVFQLVIGVCLAVNISIIVLEAELNCVSQKRIKVTRGQSQKKCEISVFWS